MEKFKVNSQERASAILKQKQVVSVEGTYKTKHRVSKRIFEWENSGDQYRIVNTQLMNSYQKKEVIALLAQEKFQEATNKGLTFRANLELAEELDSAIQSTVLVEEVEVEGGEKALLIRSMRPIGAVKAQSFDYESIFMSEAPEITVKAEEKETD